jgi:splicing factor 3A subunit 3
VECSSRLQELYDDKDGQRKDEVAALSGPNEFKEFYDRLKQIKDFHRQHPDEISVPMSIEFDELKKMRDSGTNDEASNMADFTDEEGYGKYLDLHEHYEKYVNLKGADRVDYVTFLSTFDKLAEFPRERKGAEYKRYLGMLLDYFYHYLERIRPLYDLHDNMELVRREFETKWAVGDVTGWPKELMAGGAGGGGGGALSNTGAHLDLSAFSSWDELAKLGLNRLKSALMALGLKCGGTLEERAQRLFGTKGKDIGELDPSLFAKNKGGGKGGPDKSRESEKAREVGGMEAQIFRFAELLIDQRAATKENVERKQARTEMERDDSDNELSEEEGEDENDDDDIPYNPKNLPLGWDGKPIPYWLYKLHGLNISYNCEICGNFTYKVRFSGPFSGFFKNQLLKAIKDIELLETKLDALYLHMCEFYVQAICVTIADGNNCSFAFSAHLYFLHTKTDAKTSSGTTLYKLYVAS